MTWRATGGATPTTSTGAVPVVIGDGANLDAFSRLRVSLPKLRVSTVFDTDKRPLFWDEVLTGTGTGTHDADKGAVVMRVAASGDAVLRRTKEYFVYRAMQGQLIAATFVLAAPATSVSIVLRSFTSGAAVDNPIAQASWNVDPMDGTGPSGITLDFTKAQILVIDFQSLYVGRVRVGFDVDGVIHYAHQFLNANVLDVPFWRRAKLPIQYSIAESGGTLTQEIGYGDDEDGVFLQTTGAYAGGNADLLQICAAVIREGGDDEPSVEHEARSNSVVNVGTSWETVLGVRLAATHIRATIRMLGAVAFNTDADYGEYAVVLNPSYAGSPTWSSLDADDVAEVAEFNAAISVDGLGNPSVGHTYPLGGYLAGGGVGNRTAVPSSAKVGDTVPVVADIAGTPDEAWLVARMSTGTGNVRGILIWREER